MSAIKKKTEKTKRLGDANNIRAQESAIVNDTVKSRLHVIWEMESKFLMNIQKIS